jgi:hypothetical protein
MAVKPYLAAALVVGLALPAYAAPPAQNANKPIVREGEITTPQGIVTYAFRLEPGRYRVMLTADPKAALVVYPPETFDEVPVPCGDNIAATNPASGVAGPARCDVTVRSTGSIGVSIEPRDFTTGEVLTYTVRVKRIGPPSRG